WNTGQRSRPVRLAAQVAIADGSEGAREANARQELRRGNPGTLATGLDRHLAIALGIRIAGIQHHLALELVLQILADLRQGSVRDRDQDHVSEDGCLSRRAGARLGPERPRHALELVPLASRQTPPGTPPDPNRGA